MSVKKFFSFFAPFAENEFEDDNDLITRKQQGPTFERESMTVELPGDMRRNKVVNIHATTQLAVVLVKPERFDSASEIADHLRDKRTVVLNLENAQREVARRLLDFLSGVAYANEGKIKKVASAIYIITPFNVEIMGDLIDELENNGMYF